MQFSVVNDLLSQGPNHSARGPKITVHVKEEGGKCSEKEGTGCWVMRVM
jgi:hypothetical protein